ncbi:FecCD family ABC transporter permease [Microbacterium sp.]|uniref:FecCD family ABC transporter permease n=1 Tax=Microbacterium sp. TaxID=51671 RepID=UPI0039E5E5BF
MTRARIDHGYRAVQLRTPVVSGRLGLRLLLACIVLLAAAVAAAYAAVFLGDYPLTTADVTAALTGSADEFTTRVVREWRLPVAIAAVLFGLLLGIGGAIFQSLTRNPLGSPDVIGFDAGSYTAVVVVMLVLGAQHSWTIAVASIAGGLVTALAVYLLAYRRGVQGFRLIIVGIAVAAALGSINTYLITRADVRDAMQVGFWGAGSLTRVTWTTLTPSLTLAVAIIAAAAVLAPALRSLELGDDTASTHGTRVGASRLALLTVGVATTALVTAAAGPIGFVALVAPQLARRVTRTPGVSILAAGAMGAALLAAAHLLSQVLSVIYRPVPVGLLTICVGGVYLIVLLVRESRAPAGGPR